MYKRQTIDNTGRTGIELQYDQYLSGIAGRWVKNTDLSGNELVNGSEAYYEAEDGLNVVLTIDAVSYTHLLICPSMRASTEPVYRKRQSSI